MMLFVHYVSLLQIFSLLFISLVVYLDLLCWTVLTAPWLFLGASACVWLEMIRTIGKRMHSKSVSVCLEQACVTSSIPYKVASVCIFFLILIYF